MRPSIAPVPALAIGMTLVFAFSASATPLATSIEVRTSLSAAQEVPAPTGDVSAASGSFTGTVMKEDSGSAISWRLSYSGLTGDAVERSHPPRSGRAGRAGGDLSLRPLSEPDLGHSAAGHRRFGRHRERQRVRERPHDHEHSRRDPGPGRNHGGHSHQSRSATGSADAKRQRPQSDGTLHSNGDEAVTDGGDHMAPTVLGAHRASSRSAHPPRAEGPGRPGGRISLRAVPRRPAWNSQGDRRNAARTGDGSRVCQHPHGDEPSW